MIRVFIIDDHRIIRDGIRELLSRLPDFELVGEAACGLSALEALQGTTADVVLMDLSLPGLSGTELVRRLLAIDARMAILVLSMHGDPATVNQMLGAGAAGYITKQYGLSALVRGLRSVAARHRYVSPDLMDALIEIQHRGVTANALTERELEVLPLLQKGMPLKSIGAYLDISPKTVSAHKRHIMQKLNLRSNADLFRYRP